jgi:hypothetical protein
MSALLAFLFMVTGHVPGWRATRTGGSRRRALAIGAVCWTAGIASLISEYGLATAIVLGILLWSIAAAALIWVGDRT